MKKQSYRLSESGKMEQVKMIQDIADMANIYYIRQKEPKGLGHAVLCAKSFIGDESQIHSNELLVHTTYQNDFPLRVY